MTKILITIWIYMLLCVAGYCEDVGKFTFDNDDNWDIIISYPIDEDTSIIVSGVYENYVDCADPTIYESKAEVGIKIEF